MDPLSDLLSLLKPRSYVSAGFDAGGAWSVRFSDQHGRMKCYSVISGGCWLAVDDVPAPVWLSAGDCFVLPSGRPFVLASDPGRPPVEAKTVFPPARNGGTVILNGGGSVFLAGSRFEVAGHHAAVLLRLLPPIIHLGNETEQAALRWTVEQMMRELHDGQPGADLIAQHLAHMMLVQALRLYLRDGAPTGAGWLAALADGQMSRVLAAIHVDPARRWVLQDLAATAGMSRSTFALRFREIVGETPMDYIARWRMLLAADRLTNTDEPLTTIALSLGYESESAFSTAFKRVIGCSPRAHCRRAGTVAADARSVRAPHWADLLGAARPSDRSTPSRLPPMAGE